MHEVLKQAAVPRLCIEKKKTSQANTRILAPPVFDGFAMYAIRAFDPAIFDSTGARIEKTNTKLAKSRATIYREPARWSIFVALSVFCGVEMTET